MKYCQRKKKVNLIKPPKVTSLWVEKHINNKRNQSAKTRISEILIGHITQFLKQIATEKEGGDYQR